MAEQATKRSVSEGKKQSIDRPGNKNHHQFRKDQDVGKTKQPGIYKRANPSSAQPAGNQIELLSKLGLIDALKQVCSDDDGDLQDPSVLYCLSLARCKFGSTDDKDDNAQVRNSELVLQLTTSCKEFYTALHPEPPKDDLNEPQTSVFNTLQFDIALNLLLQEDTLDKWKQQVGENWVTGAWTEVAETSAAQIIRHLMESVVNVDIFNWPLLACSLRNEFTLTMASAGGILTKLLNCVHKIANVQPDGHVIRKSHVDECNDIMKLDKVANRRGIFLRLIQFASSKTRAKTSASLTRVALLAAAHEVARTKDCDVQKLWDAVMRTHVANASKLTFHQSVRDASFVPPDTNQDEHVWLCMAAAHTSVFQLCKSTLAKHITVFPNSKKKLQVAELFQILESDLGLQIQMETDTTTPSDKNSKGNRALHELQEQVKSLIEDRCSYAETVSELESINQVLSEEVEDLKQTVSESRNLSSDESKQIAQLEGECAALEQNNFSLDAEVAELKEQVVELTHANEELTANVDENEHEIEEMRKIAETMNRDDGQRDGKQDAKAMTKDDNTRKSKKPRTTNVSHTRSITKKLN